MKTEIHSYLFSIDNYGRGCVNAAVFVIYLSKYIMTHLDTLVPISQLREGLLIGSNELKGSQVVVLGLHSKSPAQADKITEKDIV